MSFDSESNDSPAVSVNVIFPESTNTCTRSMIICGVGIYLDKIID